MKNKVLDLLAKLSGSHRAVLLLLVVALVVQIVLIAGLNAFPGSKVQSVLHVDEYWPLATNLKEDATYSLDGSTLSRVRQPMTALAFAGLRIAFGDSYLPIYAFQTVVNLLTVFLLYLIARDVWGRAPAFLLLLMLSLYVPLLVFAGSIMSEPFFIFWLALATYLALRTAKTRNTWATLGCGVALAFAALTRTSAFLLPGALILFMGIYLRQMVLPWRKILLTSMVILVSYVAVLSPWAVRNYRVTGTFTPLASETGYALWLSTKLDLGQWLRGGEAVTFDPMERDKIRAGAYFIDTEADSRFREEALLSIREAPLKYVAKGVGKTAIYNLHLFGTLSISRWVIRLPVAVIVMLSAVQLALIAMAVRGFLKGSPRGKALIVATVPLYYLAANFFAVPADRYLLPTEPFFLALVAAGLMSFIGWGRQER